MVKLIGTSGNQVPTNNMLGNMAFQNKEGVSIDLLGLAAGTAAAPSLIPSGDPNTGVWFPAADTIAASTGGTERVRITSGGNVGIGITPSAWRASELALQVSNASISNVGTSAKFNANYFVNASNANIYLSNGFASFYQQTSGQHQWFTAASGTAGGNVSFSQVMTLDASGNLGIGVTPNSWFTDYRVLQIGLAGSVFNDNFQEDMNISSNAYADTRGGYKFIRNGFAQRLNITNNGSYRWFISTASGTAGNAITFTQAMTLDSGGNLSLGIIPVAWSSGYRAVDIGSGSIMAQPSGSDIYFTQNAYFDGAWRYKFSSTNSSRFQQVGGVFSWHNAASGSVGSVISFTQAMTLNASGNLGIGTTSPTSRLTVDTAQDSYIYVRGTGGFSPSSTTLAGVFRDGLSSRHALGFNTITSGYNGVLTQVNNSLSGWSIDGMTLSSGFESQSYLAVRYISSGGVVSERMQVDYLGNVIINSAAVATTATDGFLYIPGCAGTPTGTPSAKTGRVPLVVDTTNNKLYFYSGGAWRDAGP